MSPFTSYQKIAETTKDWQLEHPKQLSRVTWCVTEKIHGANFCFIQSKDGLLVAKRKAIVENDEEFFGYQKVKERLAITLRGLFTLLESQISLSHLYVYGELFGGAYPHFDIKPIANVQAVQTGVYYTPDISFIAFDLAVSEGIEVTYLDYTKAIELFKQVNLFYAEPLFIGSFTDALEFSERFASTIPKRLGLPELDNNFAEGIVIKPMQEILVRTNKGSIRPILKKKIAEFAEDERFHQAEKQKPRHNEGYLLEQLEYELYQLVNINRLQSAASKVGNLEIHQEEIKKLITEDAWESLGDKYGDKLSGLSSEDRDLLMIVLDELADNIVKTQKSST
jgi:Rnl2 family RNA ligase